MNQLVLVLDFGGPYKELIARRVREHNVASEIVSGRITAEEILRKKPVGIIVTGAGSVTDAPDCDARMFNLGIPVLGICYGMQLMAQSLGGTVAAGTSEYGRVKFTVNADSPLFDGLSGVQTGSMSHSDEVTRVPEGFTVLASTADCAVSAMSDGKRKLYATQFHPEMELTSGGDKMLHNFLYNICGAIGDYSIGEYREKMVAEIRETVGEGRVLLAMSGGVDSSVCAALLAEAIPGRLHCIFVDHGFMRLNEGDEVEAAFKKRALHLVRVNAQDRFLAKLDGVTDPERKRKIIGEEFIRVFEDEARKLESQYGKIEYLGQGTIYPDIVESGMDDAATIKSHHNVGGLPDDIGFAGLVEPLRGLFKDEVRALGRELQLPKSITERQPFPGPGLAVRVIGALTREKLDTLRLADAIFRGEMKRSRQRADQYFAVLTDTRSVGVVGDSRTYGWTVALRAVTTSDFMTCEYVPLSHNLLGRCAKRIVAEVEGVSRVVYDVTGKPPATIEWE